MFPVYAVLNRIRLASSPAVVAAADELVRHITDPYFAPNFSIGELRELARGGTADPLREFSQASREELRALRDEG